MRTALKTCWALCLLGWGSVGSAQCGKPLYLTFDTGHMGVAPWVAQVLDKHAVKATFFVANEKTKTDGASLDAQWLPWWRERVAQGHLIASHTWDHVYWVGDVAGSANIRVKPAQGAQAGQVLEWTPAQYCAELNKPLRHMQQQAQAKPVMLFRAPGGKTSPRLLEIAKSCGYAHVGWSPAGFLGDELPSERYPNATLLSKALRDVRSGDILLAHLGIWSRQDPWAPAVLEPLIEGLKAKGFCFKTLAEHPQYAAHVASTPFR
jgi:peptidoglycan-N-acetylmuramic acid deacetylase